jgi:hypothetical protein
MKHGESDSDAAFSGAHTSRNEKSKRMPALDAANDLFHEAYGATRDCVSLQVPVLVVLSGELVLHHHGERRAYPYSHPFFKAAKSAAHIAVALFALTCDESPTEQTHARLRALRKYVAESLDGLRGEPVQEHALLPLLEACASFAERALSGFEGQGASREEFARHTGPIILRVTELATREQVAGLHGAVEAALGVLSAADRRVLQVVVVGDHQARKLSLGMQYFKRRLQEPDGADDRVTYGENVSTEAEALTLVGTRRLDEMIAGAFFGDETRLRRDVLGDAAKKCLETLDLAPIR